MQKILIVEDDIHINNMIFEVLSLAGYEPISTKNASEALEKCETGIDLILLDLMLPGMNGKELIQELKRKVNCPIIVVSAISDVDMKVVLFDLGADDYITKPFQNKELFARITLAFRHKGINRKLLCRDLELNLDDFVVFCNKEKLELTKNEFEILKLLMTNQNKIVTKSTLFDTVWGNLDSADENTLNVHISKLRTKLKHANPNVDYIETIWKIGYKLK